MVKEGQVWKENDPRRGGREVMVMKIDTKKKKAIIKTVKSKVGSVGKVTYANLSRFNEKSRGYSLIQAKSKRR